MSTRFVEGQRCVTAREIDLQAYGILPSGTRLQVSEVCANDDDMGFVAFKLLSRPQHDSDDDVILVGNDLDQVSASLLSRARARLPDKTWLAALAVVCGLVGLDVLSSDVVAHAFRKEPFVYHDVRLVSPDIGPNEDLVVGVHSKTNRVCRWTWVNHFAHVLVGGRTRVFADTQQFGSGTNDNEDSEAWFIRLIHTPPNMKPGEYQVSTDGIGECDHGDIFKLHSNTFRFTVEQAAAAS